MWKITQELLPWFLAVLLISQYVLPVIFNQQTWWLFRSKKTSPNQSSTLADEINETKEVVDQAKSKVEIVKEKVEDNLKSAEDLKNKVDKL